MPADDISISDTTTPTITMRRRRAARQQGRDSRGDDDANQLLAQRRPMLRGQAGSLRIDGRIPAAVRASSAESRKMKANAILDRADAEPDGEDGIEETSGAA